MSQAKIAVCSRSFSANRILRSELESAFPNVKFNDTGRTLAGDELVSFLQGCDRAIIALEKLDQSTIQNLNDLHVIGKYGVGLDNLDLPALAAKGIQLGWMAGVNSRAVAELTIGLSLNIVRLIVESNSVLKSGEFKQIIGQQLSSLKIGIIGYGHVGSKVASLFKAFGSEVFCHDIKNISIECEKNGYQNATFEQVISTCDLITLHVPKTKATSNFIDGDILHRMKKGSYLINTARGGLVDEQALLTALNDGHLRGAGFDVFSEEPPEKIFLKDLIQHPRFCATTHIGGSSEEAILAMGRSAIRGLSEFKEASAYVDL